MNPQWWLDVPQAGNVQPSATISPYFIAVADLTAHPTGLSFGIIPSVHVTIRNRMDRILLFEFTTANGAILPVVVDPLETAEVNARYSLVSVKVFDPSQFAVGQSPSATHFQVPFGQDAGNRPLDGYSYINSSATSTGKDAGGYALLVCSDQSLNVSRSAIPQREYINFITLADTNNGGLGTFTFDASNNVGNNILALDMWAGFHALNYSGSAFTINTNFRTASDAAQTFIVPPFAIASIPLECRIIAFTLNDKFQGVWGLQRGLYSGAVGP